MAPNLDHDLPALAQKLGRNGPHKILETSKRIRIVHQGKYLADTTEAMYVWEHPYYPQYYIPVSDFDLSLISEGDGVYSPDGMEIARVWSFKGSSRGDTEEATAICFMPEVCGPAYDLRARVKVIFGKVDQWFEEDTPIHVHPKDPYKRIDILHSSRTISISIGGVKVAESRWSAHLFETGLPTRYYLPLSSVDQSVLRKSNLRTQCPYKGEAEYYHVQMGRGKVLENIVWYYTRPTSESAAIQGLVCFYNEKVTIEFGG